MVLEEQGRIKDVVSNVEHVSSMQPLMSIKVISSFNVNEVCTAETS